MSTVGHSIAIIGVVAAGTVILRAVPFLVFGGKREVPEWIHYLGKFLPAAIMAVLVVYCLRNIQLFQGDHGIPALISTGLVVVLHTWKKNILLTVSLGTACYMVLMRVFF